MFARVCLHRLEFSKTAFRIVRPNGRESRSPESSTSSGETANGSLTPSRDIENPQRLRRQKQVYLTGLLPGLGVIMATICRLNRGDRSFSSCFDPCLASAPVIPHPVAQARLLLAFTGKAFSR
ncbi:hypothetical protein NG799_01195 [Laspinema sp. D1]|uniref:Uncharacterized protein n=1 Tax=Laspinema palackyanum D2a TaxID=2953684 RepID=A0ABT2MJN5_9CYAN|nr:hypothetical protein [Laspinema sp. D2a]